MNLSTMVGSYFCQKWNRYFFGYLCGSTYLFFDRQSRDRFLSPTEIPSKLISKQWFTSSLLPIFLPWIEQESSHMFLYFMATHHKLLKMSMRDGLVEGLCMVLISIFQISHFMLGQHAVHQEQNKPSMNIFLWVQERLHRIC